jgi:hypothetical protein
MGGAGPRPEGVAMYPPCGSPLLPRAAAAMCHRRLQEGALRNGARDSGEPRLRSHKSQRCAPSASQNDRRQAGVPLRMSRAAAWPPPAQRIC